MLLLLLLFQASVKGARVANREMTALICRLVSDYKISLADPNSKYQFVLKSMTTADPYPELKFEKRSK